MAASADSLANSLQAQILQLQAENQALQQRLNHQLPTELEASLRTIIATYEQTDTSQNNTLQPLNRVLPHSGKTLHLILSLVNKLMHLKYNK